MVTVKIKRLCSFALLTVLLGWSIDADAQSHFTSCISRTAESATVIIPAGATLTVGGSAIANGDEIAVFTPDGKCAGVAVWNSNPTALTVWGADDLSAVGGLKAGDPLRMLVWDASARVEFNSVSATYSNSKPYLRTDGTYASGAIFEISALNAGVGTPALLSPANGAINIPLNGNLGWKAVQGATTYDVQVSTNNTFSALVLNKTGVTGTSLALSGLANNVLYYWRVRAYMGTVAGPFSGTGNFKTVGIAYSNHAISLNQGWNLISSYLMPRSTSMDSVFSKLASLQIVRDALGGTYQPSNNIRTLTSWTYTNGYRVFVTSAATLTITGTPLAPAAASRQLVTGWNEVAYLVNASLPVADATASLDSGLVIVKDLLGNLYLPQYEINTIGNMIPGRGYQIFMRNNEMLVYPTVTSANVASGPVSMSVGASAANSGMVSSAFLLVETSSPNGSIVSVWAGDRMLASGTVEEGRVSLVVPGYCPLSRPTGAKEGEALSLRAGTTPGGASIEPNSTQDILTEGSAALVYKTDAVLLVKASHVATGTEENPNASFELKQNYPNPAQATTQIEIGLDEAGEVRLELFNILGQRVETILSETRAAGRYTLEFNTTDLANGTYVYRLTAGKRTLTRTMVVAH